MNTLIQKTKTPGWFSEPKNIATSLVVVALLGGLTYGLTMRYLGLSLGTGVALGYCAAFGTLVPPIVQKEFADKLLNHSGTSAGGPIVLFGVIVCLAGIAIGGYAGVRKEREMGAQASTIQEFSSKSAHAKHCGFEVNFQ